MIICPILLFTVALGISKTVTKRIYISLLYPNICCFDSFNSSLYKKTDT